MKINSTLVIVIVGAIALVGIILQPGAEWLKDVLLLVVGGLIGHLTHSDEGTVKKANSAFREALNESRKPKV